jgi:hypothetical protein
MGMLRRMKDLRDMAEGAPGLMAPGPPVAGPARQRPAVEQLAAAQQAAAQAQLARYQTQAAAAAAVQGYPPGGPEFEPVAGVSLEQFATVSKGVAAYGYDGSKLVEIAGSQGIDAASWENASEGWNARIEASPTVAQRFNQLYREA